MSDLTPEQSAQLAVDGVVRADDAVHVEASTDPADLHVSDWQRVQWLHRQGDERGLMAEVQRIHREAVEQERERIAQAIERQKEIAEQSRDIIETPLPKNNFDQQAWAYGDAARIVRGAR